jgi:Holliday junction resolvase RusA-like endonuclease
VSQSILLIIEGEPVGKGRPKATSQGGFVRMYTPEKTRSYEERIATEARKVMMKMPPIDGPVAVEMQMYHSIRPSWSKAKQEAARLGRIVPTIKVDADNCLKVFCDALNGVAWIDDVQVVDVALTKRFAEQPCVVFKITPLDYGSA